MAWEPEKQIIQSSPLLTNLLTYIKNNQIEAFKWANDGNLLKSFAAVYNSAQGRVVEVFPSLLVVQSLLRSTDNGDNTDGIWSVQLEIALEGSDAEKLTNESLKYRDAIESMVKNIESDDLTVGFKNPTIARTMDTILTVFDEIAKGKKSPYTQIFTTSVEFEIRAATL